MAKNPAAVELGRLGGLARVPKGTAALDPEQMKERSRKMLVARWGKKKKVAKVAKKQVRK